MPGRGHGATGVVDVARAALPENQVGLAPILGLVTEGLGHAAASSGGKAGHQANAQQHVGSGFNAASAMVRSVQCGSTSTSRPLPGQDSSGSARRSHS